MDEWISKAIPLRRTRGGSRATAPRGGEFRNGIAHGVRVLLTPPRELWLASLGGTSMALRFAQMTWSHMVAEGVQAEGAIRRVLGRGPAAGTAA